MAHTQVTAGSAGTTSVFAAAPRRKLLILQVPAGTAEAVRVSLDGTTASATNGIPLAVGGGLVLSGNDTPTGAVLCWSSGGTGTLAAFEDSYPAGVGRA